MVRHTKSYKMLTKHMCQNFLNPSAFMLAAERSPNNDHFRCCTKYVQRGPQMILILKIETQIKSCSTKNLKQSKKKTNNTCDLTYFKKVDSVRIKNFGVFPKILRTQPDVLNIYKTTSNTFYIFICIRRSFFYV